MIILGYISCYKLVNVVTMDRSAGDITEDAGSGDQPRVLDKEDIKQEQKMVINSCVSQKMTPTETFHHLTKISSWQ